MDMSTIQATRLVVIDDDVANAERTIRGMDLNVQVLQVGTGSDALIDILFAVAALVRDRDRQAALDLITHGRPGAIYLGGRTFDAAAVDDEALLLGVIGKGMAPHGGVHLWSSEAGTGPEGRAFVNRLAHAIGRPVTGASRRIGAGVPWTHDIGPVRAASWA